MQLLIGDSAELKLRGYWCEMRRRVESWGISPGQREIVRTIAEAVRGWHEIGFELSEMRAGP